MEKLTGKQIEQLQMYSRETEALYSEYATKDGDAVRMHGDTPLGRSSDGTQTALSTASFSTAARTKRRCFRSAKTTI